MSSSDHDGGYRTNHSGDEQEVFTAIRQEDVDALR